MQIRAVCSGKFSGSELLSLQFGKRCRCSFSFSEWSRTKQRDIPEICGTCLWDNVTLAQLAGWSHSAAAEANWTIIHSPVVLSFCDISEVSDPDVPNVVFVWCVLCEPASNASKTRYQLYSSFHDHIHWRFNGGHGKKSWNLHEIAGGGRRSSSVHEDDNDGMVTQISRFASRKSGARGLKTDWEI